MLSLLPEFNALCLEVVNMRIKQYIYVCDYICNYICAIWRIKVYIWIQTDIGACACIFDVCLGQRGRAVLCTQPSSTLQPALPFLLHCRHHHNQWLLPR